MSNDSAGGVKPKENGIKSLNESSESVFSKTESISLFNVPSPHITEEHMFEIANVIIKNEKKYDGFIVLHGTDTVEETAYFVDLLLTTEKPVVFTMAMRSQSELAYDGLRNVANSIRVCESVESKSRKVMLCVADKLYCSHEATKTSTYGSDAFTSSEKGLLGYIDHDKVVFYRDNKRNAKALKPKKVLKKVYIIKLHAGCDSLLIDTCIANNSSGMVIEAFGKGNLPLNIMESIKKAIANGIVVVVTSRVKQGRVSPLYSYDGGGKVLEKMGVILADDLTSEKARIKLSLLLSSVKKNSKSNLSKSLKPFS
jgi:L-asparaginase